MKFINELKIEMSNLNALKIAYAIVPINAKYDKRYYKVYSFPIRIPKYDFENYSLSEIYRELTEFENIIEIRNTDSGEYYINGIRYPVENLKKVVKEKIKRNPNYVVKYYINDNVDFSVYFNVISKIKEAVNELRNEYSLLTYSRNYDDLEYEQMKETIKKYDFRIFDITSEMKKQLED